MKTSIIVALMTSLIVVSGCSTNKYQPITPESANKVISSIPSWYIKSPADSNDAVYQSGTGLSQDLSMAVSKSVLNAQVQLADKIAAHVSSMTRDYKRDVSGHYFDDTEQVSKKVAANVELNGYTVEKESVMSEGGRFRVYVLLKYSTATINKIVMQVLPAEVQARGDLDSEIKNPLNGN